MSLLRKVAHRAVTLLSLCPESALAGACDVGDDLYALLNPGLRKTVLNLDYEHQFVAKYLLTNSAENTGEAGAGESAGSESLATTTSVERSSRVELDVVWEGAEHASRGLMGHPPLNSSGNAVCHLVRSASKRELSGSVATVPWILGSHVACSNSSCCA